MSRLYGRIKNPDGTKTWVVVQTTASGNNDLLYVTALCQCLLLNLNESPFWANNGIPAVQSVIQQVYPDYYVSETQRLFAPFFVNLQVSRNTAATTPTYDIVVLTHEGTVINASVPIPT